MRKIMPRFAWKGIDWWGVEHKGVLNARSAADLESQLLINEIGLMSYKRKNPLGFWAYIGYSYKPPSILFSHLGDLIKAGISVSDALVLIAHQTNTWPLKNILHDMSTLVIEGLSLSDACILYKDIFDAVVINLIIAGQESGELAYALCSLGEYLEIREQANRSMRAALLTPMITLIFFILIAFFVLVFVIPSLTELLITHNQEVPLITNILISISSWLSNGGIIALILLLSISLFGIRLFFKTKPGKYVHDYSMLILPGIKTITRVRALEGWSLVLALLINAKIPLSEALVIAAHTVQNFFMYQELSHIAEHVRSGKSLAVSMSNTSYSAFSQEVIALIVIGHETGNLGIQFNRIARWYQEATRKYIRVLIVLVQPIVIIILGIFISGLIVALYMPIFNLPETFSEII
jgi:type IV pilus assembly protein PilC